MHCKKLVEWLLVVDIEAAQVFATELKKIIAENDFPPDFF